MKRVERAHLAVAALTDPGRRGKNNEDRFAVSAYRRNDRYRTPALLAVIADGIGGHRAGEVAAEMAVNLISARIANSSEDEPPAAVLQDAVQTASQAIYKHASAAPEREGMGATCAIAYVIGSRLFAANIGDSRIYLLRGGRLTQLSTDHTWIQEALDHGLLNADQIQGHPNSHVIRRFLGSAKPPEPALRLSLEGDSQNDDGAGIPLQPDDSLLLCSDGLTDLVEDDEIAEALSSQPIEEAGRGLIDLANQRGGHDNITLIALQMPHFLAKKNGKAAFNLRAGCLAAVIVALLGGILFLSYRWLIDRGKVDPTPAVMTVAAPSKLEATQTALVAARTPVQSITLLPTSAGTALPSLPTVSAASMTPWPTSTVPPATVYP